MQELFTYVSIRLAQRSDVALPNIIPAVLDCISERGAKLEWRVLNCDVILRGAAAIDDFSINSSGGISWEALKSFVESIVNVNEITICSVRSNIEEKEITRMVEKREWFEFEFCIDLFDSTEWIVFSKDRRDLVRILNDSRVSI